VFGTNAAWLATHRTEGVFAGRGTDVADAEADLSIYDLAPTILHYLGVPVPEDVDGEVRRDVLTGEPADRPVEHGPPTATGGGGRRAGAEVEETLRNLGYMER
jgi:hypothetical protein